MIGEIWDSIILQPTLNSLIAISDALFGNFGLAIIALTIGVNILMLWLTLKQIRASKAMQDLQPQLAELQKKYAKDKQKLAQEQMRMYKESGMSPAGCIVPMLIQMPVWIALYQSIIRVLAIAPEDFLSLSQHLYSSWPNVFSLVPLESKFLWLDLAVPDRWLLLPILVGGTMWLQQKMMMSPTADPKQQAQSQMMLWMMPMMFAFLTLSFPSGLALYWVTSNVISIVMQYFITGWGGLAQQTAGKKDTRDKRIGRVTRQKAPLEEADISADIVMPSSDQGEGVDYGEYGDKRQDSGGSHPTRRRTTGRKPGGNRGYRRKGR